MLAVIQMTDIFHSLLHILMCSHKKIFSVCYFSIKPWNCGRSCTLQLFIH